MKAEEEDTLDQEVDLAQEITRKSTESIIVVAVREAELQRKRNVNVYHEIVREKA